MESPVKYSTWTDEKHVRYLNSMEASFVRTMFEDENHLVRLDRFLPDTADSTRDFKPPASSCRKNQTAAAGNSGGRIDGRAGRRSRRRSSQPYNLSQDQVVPQMEKRGGGVDDERDRDYSISSSN